MKKKSNLIIVSICLSLFMLSCSKEDLGNVEPVISSLPELQVKNGMLNVACDMEYTELIDFIVNCTDEEFQAWEQEIGFTSYRTHLDAFYAELECVSSQDEIFTLVSEYSSCVEIVEGIDGLEIVELIESPFYQRITNIDGVYCYDSKVSKVCGDYIYSTSDESLEELQKISKNSEENIAPNITSLKYRNIMGNANLPQLKTTDQCWSFEMYDWGWYDKSGCKNDRRIRLLINCELRQDDFDQYIYHLYALTEAKGQDKSFCVWHNKKIAGLQWKDVDYKVRYNVYNFDIYVPDRYISDAQYRTFEDRKLYSGIHEPENPRFERGNGQATHSEMYSKWAVIYCFN